VSFLSRRFPYDRKRMLARAGALESGWRWRKALALYRQILAAEPGCVEIHARVAPLLARSGRNFESWESFQIALLALRKAGDEVNERKTLRAAVRALPTCAEACRALARIERARDRSEVALRILRKGSGRMSRRGKRGEAIVVLRDAREIDPWDPPVVLSLCRLLKRDSQCAEALYLLDHLEERVSDDDRHAVRFLIWRIEPSLRHTWRWLTAAWAHPRSRSPVGASSSSRTAALRTS
jgi:tetratricopeptide (TPR) repeat protein